MTRNSIRNSESPKLYSNIPAASMATTDASAAVASDGIAVVLPPDDEIAQQHEHEPQPEGERRKPALGGDLQRARCAGAG